MKYWPIVDRIALCPCRVAPGEAATGAVSRTLSVGVLVLIAGSGVSSAQQRPSPPFWPEIRTFLKQDADHGVTSCRTVFVGSSSIRLWHHLAQDMAGRLVIRRGFGGAHLDHVSLYFDVLVARHRPRSVVLYAGENDISAGRRPKDVLASLERLMAVKRRALGATPVHYIAIKPSPRRWHEFERQSLANALIKRLAAATDDLVYVDIVGAMLDNGRPKQIFLADKLHMNRAGYRIWTKVVRRALAASGVREVQHCRQSQAPERWFARQHRLTSAARSS